MSKLMKCFILIVVCLIGATDVKAYERPQKVSVVYYEYEPYFYMDDKGNVAGIYHEIAQLLAKDLNLEIEYHYGDFTDAVELTQQNEIDLLIGVHYTPDRAQSLLYSDMAIGSEELAIFSHVPIEYGDFKALNNYSIALVNNEQNSEWLSGFLKNQGAHLNEVYVNSFTEAKKFFLLDQVDATIMPAVIKSMGNFVPVYHFSAGKVYITTGKGNEALLAKINSQLKEYGSRAQNPIELIYDKYLPHQGNEFYKVMASLLLLIFAISIIWLSYPSLHSFYLRMRIRKRLMRQQYVPFYQPIVNPRMNKVVGYEALIRLNHPVKGILSPYVIIPEIEKTKMLEEVTLALLSTIVKDYETIAQSHPQTQPIYISFNVSTHELESEVFVKKMVTLLNQNPDIATHLCLEVIEKFSISNLENVQTAIQQLKACGLKIAIDDFGVDYSNLKILEILDFDVLKLDKYFVDEMMNSKIVKHTLHFLAHLTFELGKSLVLEGVEDHNQVQLINEFGYENLYVQGYVFAKPMPLEALKQFDLK